MASVIGPAHRRVGTGLKRCGRIRAPIEELQQRTRRAGGRSRGSAPRVQASTRPDTQPSRQGARSRSRSQPAARPPTRAQSQASGWLFRWIGAVSAWSARGRRTPRRHPFARLAPRTTAGRDLSCARHASRRTTGSESRPPRCRVACAGYGGPSTNNSRGAPTTCSIMMHHLGVARDDVLMRFLYFAFMNNDLRCG